MRPPMGNAQTKGAFRDIQEVGGNSMGRRRVSSSLNHALGLPVHSAPSEAAIKRKTASLNLRAGEPLLLSDA